MTNIKDKKVLITGVSSGLGRALAEKILERGGYVAGTLRNQSQMAEFEALAPGRAVAIEMDITNSTRVKAGVEKAIARYIVGRTRTSSVFWRAYYRKRPSRS
ncbi:SDR family NAD(P)-dependent oxidoreductase [Myxosarcina sp. GI1(2024)]